MTLNILHLYPKEMNLYGDHGNVLALKRRCEWRGIDTKVYAYEPGDEIPDDIDIIFGGGGQDSGQSKIEEDLMKIAPKLKAMVEDGMPTLVICGVYQLFGKYFHTHEDKMIDGIDVMNLYTEAGPTRLIGNITIESPQFGEIVGYENHSGLTYIENKDAAFGKVVVGAGNNGTDGTEGMIYKNCIGTYLHGPILPKNPKVADYIIEKAIERKTGEKANLAPLDDTIEERAHKVSASRPR
ncbi:MAG: glutamine amidotransferase [Clostridia bacterium]|nr:glutamine amidotransferase [Clostridia bacterium]